MTIPEFSIKRRITVFMVILIVCIFGIIAFFRLRLDMLHELEYPVVSVMRRCVPRWPSLSLSASFSRRCSPLSSSPSSIRFSTGSRSPETAGGRGTGGGTPDPFKALYDTIRTTTNRVESGKVRYDVIELDNLRLQKM